jgi:hypothetical protein
VHLFIKCFGAIETSEEDAFFGFHHKRGLLENGLVLNAPKELGLWFWGRSEAHENFSSQQEAYEDWAEWNCKVGPAQCADVWAMFETNRIDR